jgi:hypothetical protein
VPEVRGEDERITYCGLTKLRGGNMKCNYCGEDILGFLVLLCLPKDRSNWLSVNTSELILRECCYHFLIGGPQTTNTSSKRIFIPKINIFNSDAVIELIKESREAVLK